MKEIAYSLGCFRSLKVLSFIYVKQQIIEVLILLNLIIIQLIIYDLYLYHKNEIMFQDTIYFDLSLLKESDKCFKCGKQITKDNLINITNGTPKGN